jgi:hypothetical protein
LQKVDKKADRKGRKMGNNHGRRNGVLETSCETLLTKRNFKKELKAILLFMRLVSVRSTQGNSDTPANNTHIC